MQAQTLNQGQQIDTMKQNIQGVLHVTVQQQYTVEVRHNAALDGQPIRAAEAATKYDITDVNLSRWAAKGLLRIIEQGPKLLILDEGDVAKAAAIYKRVKEVSGSAVHAGYVLKREMIGA